MRLQLLALLFAILFSTDAVAAQCNGAGNCGLVTQDDLSQCRSVAADPNVCTSTMTIVTDEASFEACGEVTMADTVQTITGITLASTTTVEIVGHGYANGDRIYLESITGTTELNDQWYTVSAKADDTFVLLNKDCSSGCTAYTDNDSGTSKNRTVCYVKNRIYKTAATGLIIDRETTAWFDTTFIFSRRDPLYGIILNRTDATVSGTANIIDFDHNAASVITAGSQTTFDNCWIEEYFDGKPGGEDPATVPIQGILWAAGNATVDNRQSLQIKNCTVITHTPFSSSIGLGNVPSSNTELIVRDSYIKGGSVGLDAKGECGGCTDLSTTVTSSTLAANPDSASPRGIKIDGEMNTHMTDVIFEKSALYFKPVAQNGTTPTVYGERLRFVDIFNNYFIQTLYGTDTDGLGAEDGILADNDGNLIVVNSTLENYYQDPATGNKDAMTIATGGNTYIELTAPDCPVYRRLLNMSNSVTRTQKTMKRHNILLRTPADCADADDPLGALPEAWECSSTKAVVVSGQDADVYLPGTPLGIDGISEHASTPTVTLTGAHGMSNGDVIELSGIVAPMTALNRCYIVAGAAGATFTILEDTSGTGAYVADGGDFSSIPGTVTSYTIDQDGGAPIGFKQHTTYWPDGSTNSDTGDQVCARFGERCLDAETRGDCTTGFGADEVALTCEGVIKR